MKHADHCFHCGESMRGQECTYHECRTDLTTLPVWPWSRCKGCGARVYQVMSIRQLFRQCWLVIVGVLLFLIGFWGLLFRLELGGLILISVWFISRWLFGRSRKLQTRLFVREAERSEYEYKYESGETKDTPKNRKQLKDKSDQVRSLEWKIYGNNMVRNFLTFSIVILSLGFLLTYTPNLSIAPKNTIGEKIQDKVSGFFHKDFWGDIMEDLRQKLDWDHKKMLFVHRQMMRRGLSFKKFERVEKLIKAKSELGALDRAVEVLQESDALNQELYVTLVNSLKELGKDKKKAQDDIVKTKDESENAISNYLSQLYLQNWGIILIVEVIGVLLWIIFLAVGVFCLVFSRAYEVGDEAWGKIKLNFEQIMEKRGLSKAKQKVGGRAIATGEPSISTQSSSILRGIFISVIGSTIAKIISKFGRK